MFTRTKHGADKVAKQLNHEGVAADAIHGNKSQTARQQTLNRFRQGNLRVLVATDLASRGIDVDGISHVINYDLPHEPEAYVHRIGRTGRAGADGVALSFCDGTECAALRAIEKLVRRSIAVETNHPFHGAAAAHIPERHRSHFGGKPAAKNRRPHARAFGHKSKSRRRHAAMAQ